MIMENVVRSNIEPEKEKKNHDIDDMDQTEVEKSIDTEEIEEILAEILEENKKKDMEKQKNIEKQK